VLYSVDPACPGGDRLVVAAARGLGSAVVGGAQADRFELSRAAPHSVVARSVSRKPTQLGCVDGGGIGEFPIPPAEQHAPAVDDATLTRLAELALDIERVLRFALDLEWALEPDGRIVLLQARPLRLPETSAAGVDLGSQSRRGHAVLLDGAGEVACGGIGAGPVMPVAPGDAPSDFPLGSVLVARETAPVLSPFVARASAVITEVGSAVSHLGTVAREFRVPALFGVGQALGALEPGRVVTVDADDGVVYDGWVDELVRHQLLAGAPLERQSDFRLLRRMIRRIAPLNLVDPARPEFSPEGCRTYHDILRFAHEKAVEAICDEIRRNSRRTGRHVRDLELGVPLDLAVVDLGGGLDPESGGAVIRPEALKCAPLVELIRGLTAPGVWETQPSSLDFRGFFSSALRSADLASSAGTGIERNVAVVTDAYMVLNLKLGYHFNVIDCRLGDRAEDCHLYFYFVGGVTELARRARRAELLARILLARGFNVETRGDLVMGRLSRVPREVVIERLRMAGRLIGFTRQLDVRLTSDTVADEYVSAFLDDVPLPHAVPGAQEGLVQEGSMKGPTHVMVLDDEPTVCARLKEYLSSRGYEVETFTESTAALRRLDEKAFAVVVTDLKMEGPTGLDLIHVIKKKELPTRVILITAYGSMEEFREAEHAGVFSTVTKPFRMEEMAKLVGRAAKKAGR
jgi:pyruvate,water dikinase